ncbi:hypothetical protein BDZ89DRAFT_1007692 [Hymenopellis radicata]|nr:hypothetical protein BDZ89DRAFT_1007692 [Hymenopellis radicata]
MASICSILLLVNTWIRTDASQSRTAKIAAYWMLSLNFTNVVWASRMSILFAIFRLIPPQMRLRQITNIFIIVFGLMWAGLLTQKVYICASDTYWYNLDIPQCHLGTGVAALELATDSVADLALALIPMHLLRDITLTVNQRIMLIAIFSSSLLITVASIVHAVFLLGPTGLLESIGAHIEAAVALMVASFGVVVTGIYRSLRKEGDTDPDYTYNFETSTNGGLRMQRVRRGAQARTDNIAAVEFTDIEHSSQQTRTRRTECQLDEEIVLQLEKCIQVP